MADRFADFNPRARVGRDEPIILRQNITANFNPRARVGRDAWASFWRGVVPDFNPRARVGRDCACLHGLNYSGCAIFFANLIFGHAVTGIFRRKVLCVIRVRTKILRPFSRRRCLLQHQSSFSLITWFCTDVLRFSCIFIAQVIKTQAVFFLINQRCQFMPQCAELCFIENTFKHGILHALSVAHAALRHFSQACAAGRCFRIDIVCHENQHFHRPLHLSCLFPQKRRIFLQVAA